MSEMNESDDEDNGDEDTGTDTNPVLRFVTAHFNLDLGDDIRDYVSDIRIFLTARRMYNIGVIIVVFWSFCSLLRNSLLPIVNSGDVLTGLERIISVSPQIPLLLFLFTFSSKKVTNSLTKNISINSRSTIPSIALFSLSTVSLFLAFAVRMNLYEMHVESYGPNPSAVNVVVMMLYDGLYIGLLLMGLGGAGMVLFAHQSE